MVMMLWQRWRAARGSIMPLLLLGTTRTTSALLLTGGRTSAAAFFETTTAVSSRSSRTILRPPTTTRCFWLGVAATAGEDAAEFSSTSSTSSKQEDTAPPSSQERGVPIVLLSGFLGTGKTSTLQHLLENKEQLKIGVIVNDLASVNIDRKLLVASSSSESSSDNDNLVLELQNGCACCALSDELAFSIEKLLAQRALDAVVVELSGVADPAAVRYNLAEQLPGTTRIVTLIDAASFGTDYLTWDTARDRENWVPSLPMMEEGDSNPDSHRKVSELLVEQCEAADLILVNKVDLLREYNNNGDPLRVATGVARALNAKAELVETEFGRVAPRVVLGLPPVDVGGGTGRTE